MCCAVRCRSEHNGEGLERELALRLQARSGGREQGVQQVTLGVAWRDPECGNVNDCAVDGVLRRDRFVAPQWSDFR